MALGNDGHSNETAGYLYMALGFSVVGLVIGLTMVTRMIGPASIPIWGISFVSLLVVINGPLGKALSRRISGETTPPPTALDVPDAVYAELDELRNRMLEMEERQDFAERLLAGRDAAVEAPPTGGRDG